MNCVFCGKKLGRSAPAHLVMKDRRKLPMCFECAQEKMSLLITAIGDFIKTEKRKKESKDESG